MGLGYRFRFFMFNLLFTETDFWKAKTVHEEIHKLRRLMNLPDIPFQQVHEMHQKVERLQAMHKMLMSKPFAKYERYELRIARFFR